MAGKKGYGYPRPIQIRTLAKSKTFTENERLPSETPSLEVQQNWNDEKEEVRLPRDFEPAADDGTQAFVLRGRTWPVPVIRPAAKAALHEFQGKPAH